eukprot:scaffold66016_cov34-Prasinocladus_malaysianus.AAC.1
MFKGQQVVLIASASTCAAAAKSRLTIEVTDTPARHHRLPFNMGQLGSEPYLHDGLGTCPVYDCTRAPAT